MEREVFDIGLNGRSCLQQGVPAVLAVGETDTYVLNRDGTCGHEELG